METALTAAELGFLASQKLSAEDVYDGRGQSGSQWKTEASLSGKSIVLGSPCKSASHRLKTRAGHCAQCDPKKLAYQSRHNTPGYVYIAGSLSARLLKIGTAKNVETRERNLCLEAYGGISDWKMLFYAKVENGGKIEGDALRGLEHFKTGRGYRKDGSSQQASEILRIGFSKAIDAISRAIGNSPRSDVWISPYWSDYEM